MAQITLIELSTETLKMLGVEAGAVTGARGEALVDIMARIDAQLAVVRPTDGPVKPWVKGKIGIAGGQAESADFTFVEAVGYLAAGRPFLKGSGEAKLTCLTGVAGAADVAVKLAYACG